MTLVFGFDALSITVVLWKMPINLRSNVVSLVNQGVVGWHHTITSTNASGCMSWSAVLFFHQTLAFWDLI